ncbi:uncharacterized protein EV420DRAFT_254691 [Desarmillaria tabescens]|uniref:Uncharacterized protein n=1 Tax=Armillaria tabescens TaxID=1929756 RepID=A0AA39KG52_ARMTA|nr:uncharacterized protein EV420DRAFT_254691 [Desarmillaria tabescens]KAK0460178.1 hypothetical protein EV420DRAFT_254691 [Desarmillaria tabescens]
MLHNDTPNQIECETTPCISKGALYNLVICDSSLIFPYLKIEEISMDAYANRNVVAIFNCLQLLNSILLLAVLVPALFSTRVRRVRTWYAMVISGLVYSLCYMPLMILGQQTGPPPSFTLCLLQSCLIYCAPVLIISFTLTFVVELFLVLTRVIYGSALGSSTRTQILLIAVPSLIYSVLFNTTLLMGLQQDGTIERDQWDLYCHSTASSPTLVVAIVVLMEASIIIILKDVQGTSSVFVRRRYRWWW